jgi:hypothetical protein
MDGYYCLAPEGAAAVRSFWLSGQFQPIRIADLDVKHLPKDCAHYQVILVVQSEFQGTSPTGSVYPQPLEDRLAIDDILGNESTCRRRICIGSPSFHTRTDLPLGNEPICTVALPSKFRCNSPLLLFTVTTGCTKKGLPPNAPPACVVTSRAMFHPTTAIGPMAIGDRRIATGSNIPHRIIVTNSALCDKPTSLCKFSAQVVSALPVWDDDDRRYNRTASSSKIGCRVIVEDRIFV